MQVKVKKEFKDIHTNEIHSVGEILEITETRLAEIQKVDKNMVQVIPAPVPSSSDEDSKKTAKRKGMKKDV